MSELNEDNSSSSNVAEPQNPTADDDNHRKGISYVFSGNNTKRTLFFNEGSNIEAMSCDDFKRAICRANHLTVWLASKLKLYKIFSQAALTEYKRAETIPHGSVVLVSLGGDAGVSNALNSILPTLAPPPSSSSSSSLSLSSPPLSPLSEGRIKKTALCGIDPRLDPALFREKAFSSQKERATGVFSADSDSHILQGLISASIDEFRAGKERSLARVVRAFALAAQNPKNAEMFASSPQMLSFATGALECLVNAYTRFALPGKSNDVNNDVDDEEEEEKVLDELLDETSVADALGYCLQLFVNMTHVRYSWCTRRNPNVTNPVSVISDIHRECVPESIAGLIELLERKIHMEEGGVDSSVHLSMLVLAIEAIGAIACGSLPVLTSLGSRRTFLDALVRTQNLAIHFKDGTSTAECGTMLEFRVRQAAFNFLVVGSRGSPAFSKEASVAGSLGAIISTLLWTTAAFYDGRADSDELNPICDNSDACGDDALLGVFSANDDMTPLGALMCVLSDVLAGGTTYSQWLMSGILERLFDGSSTDEYARNARAVYTKFPELQYRFVECVGTLVETAETNSKGDQRKGSAENNDDADNVDVNDDNEREIKSYVSGSDENAQSKKRMSNKSSLVADEKLWELIFSEYFMQIGAEGGSDGDQEVKLSQRKYFVCLRKKISAFIVSLSENREIAPMAFNYLLRKASKPPCTEVRVICMEVMGATLARYSENPAIIMDIEFVVSSISAALSMLSYKIPPQSISLESNPSSIDILVRYKSSRSTIVASIVNNNNNNNNVNNNSVYFIINYNIIMFISLII